MEFNFKMEFNFDEEIQQQRRADLEQAYEGWKYDNEVEVVIEKVESASQLLIRLSELPPYIKELKCRDIESDLDELGNSLLQRFNEDKLVAFESSDNGSCLYNSLSITLYGNENFSLHIRTKTLLYMVKHFNSVQSEAEKHLTTFKERILIKDAAHAALSISLLDCKSSLGWADTTLVPYCAARALGIIIHVVYPPIKGLSCEIYRDIPKYHLPLEEPEAEVYVMWSLKTSEFEGTDPNEYEVEKFNHLLPVFHREVHQGLPPAPKLPKVIITSDVIDAVTVKISSSNSLSVESSAQSILRVVHKNNNVLVDDASFSGFLSENTNALNIEHQIFNGPEDNVPQVMEVDSVGSVQPNDFSINDQADDLYIINKVRNHPHKFDNIPECKKSECYFVVNMKNRNLDDGMDWDLIRETDVIYYDVVKNQKMRVDSSNNLCYGDGSPAQMASIRNYQKLFFRHRYSDNYFRDVYAVGDLTLIQYSKCEIRDENENELADDEDDVNDNNNNTKFEQYNKFTCEKDVIRYVEEHPNKLNYIPKGNKSNSQFVIKDMGRRPKFKDDLNRWILVVKVNKYRNYDRSNGQAVMLDNGQYRYKTANRGVGVRTADMIPRIQDVVRYKLITYQHAKWEKLYRYVYMVGDNCLVQYCGEYKDNRRSNSTPAVPTTLDSPTILGNLTFLKAANLILNSDFITDKSPAGGVFKYPHPRLTKCDWKFEQSSTNYVCVTETDGRYFASESDATTTADAKVIRESIFQCACNDKIVKQVFQLENRCYVQFFGESTDLCKCKLDKVEIVKENVKLSSAKLMKRYPAEFKNQAEIRNIKAKIRKVQHEEAIEVDMKTMYKLDDEYITSFQQQVDGSELSSHMYFRDETAMDMAGLICRDGITLYCMTTNRISHVWTTMVCYVNTRLKNRTFNPHLSPMFIGPVLMHTDINGTLYQEFFSKVKENLVDAVKKINPEFTDDIDSLISYVIHYQSHNNESVPLSTAICNTFPEATEMKCARRLSREIMNHDVLNTHTKNKLKVLMDSEDREQFDQLATQLNSASSESEVRFMRLYANTILKDVCSCRWKFQRTQNFVDVRELIDEPIRNEQRTREYPAAMIGTFSALVIAQFMDIKKAFDGGGCYCIMGEVLEGFSPERLFNMYMLAPRSIPNIDPETTWQLNVILGLPVPPLESDVMEFYGFDRAEDDVRFRL